MCDGMTIQVLKYLRQIGAGLLLSVDNWLRYYPAETENSPLQCQTSKDTVGDNTNIFIMLADIPTLVDGTLR